MENTGFTKFDIAMGLAVLHHQFTLQTLLTKPTPTPIITNGKY